MFSGKKRKFLFKCDDCEMIVSVQLDDALDLKKASEDKLILECPCGGYCKILRD
jgi:hypothetical protein